MERNEADDLRRTIERTHQFAHAVQLVVEACSIVFEERVSRKIRAKLQLRNNVQGQKVYFRRIIVEEPTDSNKHTFTAKCVITEVVVKPGISIAVNHTAVRRSVLPAGFQEPE